MELELGLKITKLGDDLTSTNFRFAKDRAGLLFLSTETEIMFILTAHLKGFRREKLKIEINEEGTRITICGEKLVQEMLMMGWSMHKQEVEINVFKKVFQIPDGVILDRIKAKFNEEESVLTIRMPKSVKGYRGVGIEEMTEEVTERDRSETKIAPGKEPEETFPELVKPAFARATDHETEIERREIEQERTFAKQDSQEATEIPKTLETCASKLLESVEHVDNQVFEQTDIPSSQHSKHEEENVKAQISQVRMKMQNQNSEKTDIQDHVEGKPEQEVEKTVASLNLPADQTRKNEKSNWQEIPTVTQVENPSSTEAAKQDSHDDKASEIERPSSTTSKLFGSCFYAGSAALVTLIVFVVHLIRSKKK